MPVEAPPKKPKAAKEPLQELMQKYIAEIDRFAILLRHQQEQIRALTAIADEAKSAYERAKDNVRESKEQEHNTVSLLLKFIRPGSIEIMPLFDTMEKASEEKHGKDSDEWRQEPISSLNLSSLATRVLIDANIVLVGQLQDRVLSGPEWSIELQIADGIAQAIEAKLHDFIQERTQPK